MLFLISGRRGGVVTLFAVLITLLFMQMTHVFAQDERVPLVEDPYQVIAALSPASQVYDRDPVFSWSVPSGIPDWYRLRVKDAQDAVHLDQWLAAGTYCNETTCTYPSTLSLPGGTINWDVATYADGNGEGPWSPTFSFLIVQPIRYDPTGSATADDGQPSYTWDMTGNGETHYQVYVGRPNGMVLNQWYEAASFCNEANTPDCSFKASPILYAANFTVTADAPVAPILSSLSNGYVSLSKNLYFSWISSSNSIWHNLQVLSADGSTILLDKWVKCYSSSCGSTQTVPAGIGLKWHVRAWNAPGGYGPWSAERILTVLQ